VFDVFYTIFFLCAVDTCVNFIFFQIKKYIHGVKVQGVVLGGQKKTQQNLVKYYFLEKNHLQFLIYVVVMETHSCVLNVSVFFSFIHIGLYPCVVCS